MARRALMGALLALAPALLAFPQLPAKEAGDGWIQLFDGETLFGWQPRGDARWTVREGEIAASGGGRGMLATTTEFADFELRAEAWIDSQANSGIFLRAPVEGEVNPDSSYEVNLFDAHPQWPTGSINNFQKARARIRSVGKWTSFHIVAEGARIRVEVDGKRTVDVRDHRHLRGVIALQYGGEGSVRFRQIRVKPLGLKAIFNGRNLQGWRVLPGFQSIFSVTPEGWLNVRNGRGEIQTESQWGDFALQLDIISNGTHLNSGVFFREEPGKIWQGYESQIRNQWEDDDRARPVDFGTGGIYRRQPARRVVSNDREWLTMTIIAAGAHFAVWVNGFQTADWTDTRERNDENARLGLRLKPGAIGLQGHDPTTDLSFRRIRIAEYPGRQESPGIGAGRK